MSEQADNNSDLPKSKTKRTCNQKFAECTNLNNYQRKQILMHLKEKGCTNEEFEKAMQNYRTKKELIRDNLNNTIQQAEDNVYEECSSFSFSCITQWLELMKKSGINEHCYYESAAIINSIANNEPQPTVNECGGVDLKELYGFLGKSLLGLPQEKLSEPSAQFLSKELELLIEEANGDEAEYEIKAISNILKENAASEAFNFLDQPNKCSLDPFMLSEHIERK